MTKQQHKCKQDNKKHNNKQQKKADSLKERATTSSTTTTKKAKSTWSGDHNHDGSVYVDLRPYFGLSNCMHIFNGNISVGHARERRLKGDLVNRVDQHH